MVRTDQLNGHGIAEYAAVLVGPGSPYREPEAVIAAIRTAREQGIPLVGTPVITLLACSLMEQHITIQLTPESRLQALYGATSSVERTTCNYGLAPEVQHLAGAHGMRVAATDTTGEVRAIERTDHPFFVGTLYQPQLTSSPAAPHPVFTGLMEALRGGPRQSP